MRELELEQYQQVNLMVTKLGQLVHDSEQVQVGRESPYRTFRLERCGSGRLSKKKWWHFSYYQKSFQAASRIIRTIDEMMGTLVNM